MYPRRRPPRPAREIDPDLKTKNKKQKKPASIKQPNTIDILLTSPPTNPTNPTNPTSPTRPTRPVPSRPAWQQKKRKTKKPVIQKKRRKVKK